MVDTRFSILFSISTFFFSFLWGVFFIFPLHLLARLLCWGVTSPPFSSFPFLFHIPSSFSVMYLTLCIYEISGSDDDDSKRSNR
jgi:hypothetical protein